MKKRKGRKKLRTAKIRHEENSKQTRATYSKNEGKQTQIKQGKKGRIQAKCTVGQNFSIRNKFKNKVRKLG